MEPDTSESSDSFVCFHEKPEVYVFNPKCPTRVEFDRLSERYDSSSAPSRSTKKKKKVLKKRKLSESSSQTQVRAAEEAAKWLAAFTRTMGNDDNNNSKPKTSAAAVVIIPDDGEEESSTRHELDLTRHCRSLFENELDFVYHERRDINYRHRLFNQIPHIITCNY